MPIANSMGDTPHDGDSMWLSDAEIDLLLWQGAYGTLMEQADNESNRFCVDNIDNIIAKHAMNVRHNVSVVPGGHGSSLISKATFIVDPRDLVVDIADPNFRELWGWRRGVRSSKGGGKGNMQDEQHIRRILNHLKSAMKEEVDLEGEIKKFERRIESLDKEQSGNIGKDMESRTEPESGAEPESGTKQEPQTKQE
jgi:hypothetical protein